LQITPLLIAALAGASMAIQGTLNAVLGKRTGSFEASFVVHVLGALILGAVLLLGLSDGDVRRATEAPWWSFLGGPLSVVIIWGVIASVGSVGVGTATTAIVAAQIATALALDMLGLSGHKMVLDWTKCVGALAFILGAYLLLRETS
jgi:transporter family-2 protein